MKIDLDRAQVGLISTALLEMLVDGGNYDYEIVPTGEKASLAGCVAVFCNEIINPKPAAKKKKRGSV